MIKISWKPAIPLAIAGMMGYYAVVHPSKEELHIHPGHYNTNNYSIQGINLNASQATGSLATIINES